MSGTIDILLVEDDRTTVDLTLHVLRMHDLADRVYVARDGKEAMEFFFNPRARGAPTRPRLVLLDLKLPNGQGLDVLRRVKEDPRTHAIPVVVLSGSYSKQDMVDAFDLGANSFVQKPSGLDDLVDLYKGLTFYWLTLNKLPA
ncbi:MAG TPA: response regulator [Candidatus Thermoplasmatota archaeon]|nr:response regulator [Candidatus Thermoplasmatota archaeon]